MSVQVIQSLVGQFLANGGTVTVCPTRTAQGGSSPQRRTQRED